MNITDIDTLTVGMDEASELSAWREVHNVLLTSVRKAQEAIAIQKAQRRYWLEEIGYNLDDNGQLAIHSVWKRPVRARTNNKVEKKKRNSKIDATDKATPKKRKVTKAAAETSNNHVDDDNDMNNEVPKKKRRSKNQDKDDDAVPKKKRTKIVIKRTTPTKKQSSQKSINMDADDDSTVSDIGIGSNDIYPSTTETSQNLHDSTTLSYGHELIPSDPTIYHDAQSSVSTPFGKTSSVVSSTRDFRNEPDWMDYDNVNKNMSSPILMSRNSNSSTDDDQQQQQPHEGMQLSTIESSHIMTSPIATTTTSSSTSIIRNYTSLQDIAMNDDSDDEDRF